MKRGLIILVFLLSWLDVLHAQFAPHLKETVYMYRNNSSLSVGVTGGVTVNNMVYSAVTKSTMRPAYTPAFGFAMEWNTLRRFSVGMDLSYTQRVIKKSYSSEFQTGFSSSAYALVNYDMSLTALELRFPITCWFGYRDNMRPYLFMAPRLSYWIKGDFKWMRSYSDGSFSPSVYELKLTDAMITPLDVSAVAGVGFGTRFLVGRTRFFVKFELSYGVSLLSDFSWKEKNGTVNVLGWGDLEHEALGSRHLQNLEARLMILLPLRKFLKDACVLH